MYDVLIGNIFSLGAALSDSFSGTRKSQKSILMVQSVSQLFYIASSLVLKGYSATAQNVVAIFRNLLAASGKSNKPLEKLLIFLPVFLGIIFNNRALLGLLPVIANLEYSVAVFAFTDKPLMLKYSFILNAVLFSVFNFAILNFVGGISAIVIAVTTGISVIKEKKGAKTAE